MARIPAAHLDFLFRPPTIEPTNGWNSTVHLVRRECQETLANIRRLVDEDAFPGLRQLHRLFASAIVICSAFDLLAKLRYGDESGVGRPFQKLLVTYGGLSGIEARRVYDSRTPSSTRSGCGVFFRRRATKRTENRRVDTENRVRLSLLTMWPHGATLSP